MLDAGFHDVAVGGLGGPLGLCSGLAGNATVGLEAIEMEKKKEGLRLRLKKTPPMPDFKPAESAEFQHALRLRRSETTW